MIIRFEHVSLSFTRRNALAVPVLNNIHFAVPAGQFVCISGPSGCGKTTLLNLMAGFLFPTRGRVLFDNREVQAPGPERGVVFQEASLFPWLTVFSNVAFGLKMQGVKGQPLKKMVCDWLETMGLAEHADKYPHALSGGMRQRVALARVLALDPQLLLLDEPFSALDANARERLQDELLRLWKAQQRTVVFITHSVEEAVYLADRVIVLGNAHQGVIADVNTTLSRPRNRSAPELLAMKDSLRRCLAAQPCCIHPLILNDPL